MAFAAKTLLTSLEVTLTGAGITPAKIHTIVCALSHELNTALNPMNQFVNSTTAIFTIMVPDYVFQQGTKVRWIDDIVWKHAERVLNCDPMTLGLDKSIRDKSMRSKEV